MLKFIHAADLHLDSPLKGLERYEGAPVERIRTATRSALENLVQLAIRERVQFVLLAGDLYDGDWRDYHTGLFFIKQMSRLREAGIPVIAIAGNHDAANQMTRSLRVPDNVTLLSADLPQSLHLHDLDVVIHGQSFATQAVLDDLSLRYPAAIKGHLLNIGLLHTCATGQDGHARYAPCTIDGLRGKGYDYWALGHIHKREVLLADPVIAFPGNIQGRHIRETGPKGCLLVSVAPGGRPRIEFHRLDVVTWHLLALDASGSTDLAGIQDALTDKITPLLEADGERLLAVRVEIQGESVCDAALRADLEKTTRELQATAMAVDPGRIWLEKIRILTQPPGKHEPSDDATGALEALESVLAEARADPVLRDALGEELRDLVRKLPADLEGASSGNPQAQSEWLSSVLEDAGALLRSRLANTESAG